MGARPPSPAQQEGTGTAGADRDPEPEQFARGLIDDQTSGAPVPNPAVLALLSDAEARHESGQAEAAADSLERALKLAPGDPVLWHRLSLVRLTQQRWDQAEALAQKSNSLAGSDRVLQSANWRIIARSRSGRGDTGGAQRAHAEAAQLADQ